MNLKNCLIDRLYLCARVVNINKYSIIFKLPFILNIPQNPFFVNIYRVIMYIKKNCRYMSDRTIQVYGMLFGCVFILWHVLKNEVKNNSHIFGYSEKVSKIKNGNTQFFHTKKKNFTEK